MNTCRCEKCVFRPTSIAERWRSLFACASFPTTLVPCPPILPVVRYLWGAVSRPPPWRSACAAPRRRSRCSSSRSSSRSPCSADGVSARPPPQTPPSLRRPLPHRRSLRRQRPSRQRGWSVRFCRGMWRVLSLQTWRLRSKSAMRASLIAVLHCLSTVQEPLVWKLLVSGTQLHRWIVASRSTGVDFLPRQTLTGALLSLPWPHIIPNLRDRCCRQEHKLGCGLRLVQIS